MADHSTLEGADLVTGSDMTEPADEVYVFPASFGQKRLWFLDQFEPNSPYYNIPTAFRLVGTFAFDIFHTALQEVVNRHESLRTTLVAIDGQPRQVITPRGKAWIQYHDISQMPEAEREVETRRLVQSEAQAPFDLSQGPLLRCRIIRLAGEDHIILVTMHHIISDGWSVAVLMNELTTLYAAFVGGKPSPLPLLKLQYADFAQWQQEWMQGDILERQLAYWKRQLGGAPELLEIPTDRPRPPVYTNVGRTVSVTYTQELLESLGAMGKREGVTLFMLLLTAFQTLLHRYSSQEDICVGTPIANRTRAELEDLIGLFINTLVIRTNFSGGPSFREVLHRVRETTLDAYTHQDLPFEMLLEVLQLDRDMSHPPLFQVMFILQNAPSTVQILPGATLTTIEAEMGTATYDMTLSVSEMADGLNVGVEYNTDLFDESTIRRLLRHYELLLRAIIRHPEMEASRLPMLAEEEMRQVLEEWSGHQLTFPNLCVHEVIQINSRRTPESIAIVSGSTRCTYGELDTRAEALARYLRHRGITREKRVAICMEKSVEMIVAVLGVLRSGGAYVPLDPLQPAERLSFMFGDSESVLLLTQQDLLDAIPPFPGETICLDKEWSEIAATSIDGSVPDADPDALAYMIYTSGTTGKPKGTLITHRSLANAYYCWEREYELTTVARSHLQMANFAFDVFTGDLVRALCSGGKLVLCPGQYLLDAEHLYGLMLQEKVTIAEFVPAVLRNLIAYLERTGQRLDFLRLLIAGSDIWYAGEYKKFQKFVGPHTRVINSFGLTEATIDSTYFEASSLKIPDERLVPIGRAFANSRMYILDRHLQPVPVGVTGEVFVGGLGLARGYHGRPDLTADKFIPDPHSHESGNRLYRTGDLARYLHDGNIEFLGRKDHQVKVRGNRVELGEIETVIGRSPDVKEGVVVAREDHLGTKSLIAYLVPSAPGALSIDRVRRYLQENVPDYMIPSAFVVLEALPLTPNGKVDRKALPAPDLGTIEIGEEYVAPRTPMEETVAKIWCDVLSLQRVGIHDNFFLLGGHSLLATQLVSRLRDQFNVEVPLRTIFERPTVVDIAAAVERLKAEHREVQAPPLVPVPRTSSMPLSFAQQRLWFLDQLEPNSPAYNMPEVYRIIGPLSHASLERAFQEVVRRHENLRSGIKTVDGQPVQQSVQDLHITLPVTDMMDIREEDRHARALMEAERDAHIAIPLDRAPLFRVRLMRFDPDDHVIILIMHHIISDDWSTRVLLEEVGALYAAFSSGQPPYLPPLQIQYADYASWQRSWLQGEVLASQIEYWKDRMAGSPPMLDLPLDRPRPPVQTFAGAYTSFMLPESLARSLHGRCKEEGVTAFMYLLTAFNVLLSRYSGQKDICVGTPIANRQRGEIERLIGFFVNTLVIRTDLSGTPTFRTLLQRVRARCLEAYAHQDVPFEMIVDALHPERNLGHSPLFQVMFVLQNAAETKQSVDVQDISIRALDAHSGTAKFDLTLFMVEGEAALGGALEYNTDLFDAATIQSMIGHLQVLLAAIVEDPDKLIQHLPLLEQEERSRIVHGWNNTAMEIPAGTCIQQMFAEEANRAPEAKAVVCGEQTLSYRDLDVRSNQLAHYLRRHGVGPDVLVGVSMQRSVEMVVALLGILKAGGAYLPLDPSYPPDRLAYMVADSGIRLLLTQGHLVDQLPAGGSETYPLDQRWQEIETESGEPVRMSASAGNLVYVIYTSGSTGRPKGVMIHHRGLANYLTWCRKAYPLFAGTGSPVHSSISFDLTVTSIFTPLVSGRTVHLLEENLGLDGLAESFRANNEFSVVKITPAQLEMLSLQLSPHEAHGRTRAFVIGGENLVGESIRFWQEHATETLLINEYGPTETVVGCCVYTVPVGDRKAGSVPIGKPIINTQLYILDAALEPVPPGVTGELYIGGEGVARGYLGRPDLTAERFIPDPFGAAAGARLYRTGDLCRYLKDGTIEYLGRTDDQVKLRGFRIEIGEIEAVLSSHPKVGNCAVALKEDPQHNKRLVGYVVMAEGQEFDPAELQRSLQGVLPVYMVPDTYVELESLPLTPNGKVDRRALPEPGRPAPSPTATFVAPTTPREIVLSRIWAQVLGLERVGVTDDFFGLGGDSIQTIQVIAQARRVGIQLSARMMFQFPTIELLARESERAQPVVAEQDVIVGPVALTPVQRWFFEQHLAQPNHWNQSLLLRLSMKLNPAVLHDAVAALMKHHDVLRLRFAASADGWEQRIEAYDEHIPFSVVDLSDVPDDQLSTALEKAASTEQANLDITNGPIFRVAYFETNAARDPYLLLVVHHLAIDAVSWQILTEDLQEAYQTLADLRPVVFPPKTTSFRYYAEKLLAYGQSDEIRKEAAYWHSTLTEESTQIPVDFPEGDNLEESSASELAVLDETLTGELLHRAGNRHTEVTDVLLTALAVAVGQRAGSRSLLVSVEGHGREEISPDMDLMRTVGWFTSMYPVLLDVADSGGSLPEALRANSMRLRDIPNKGLGYGILRYASNPEAATGELRTDVAPEVSFNYLGNAGVGTGEGGLISVAPEKRGRERGPLNKRTHELEIDGGIAAGRLQLQWTYSSRRLRRETVQEMVKDFLSALKVLITSERGEEDGELAKKDYTEFGWSESDVQGLLEEIGREAGHEEEM